MHHGRLSAHHALGTRGGARGDAAATGSPARNDASTTTNGRAPVRHDHVLAYNLKRVMRILGIGKMLAAIREWGARALLRAQFQPVSAVQSVNAAQPSPLHSCSFASAPAA